MHTLDAAAKISPTTEHTEGQMGKILFCLRPNQGWFPQKDKDVLSSLQGGQVICTYLLFQPNYVYYTIKTHDLANQGAIHQRGQLCSLRYFRWIFVSPVSLNNVPHSALNGNTLLTSKSWFNLAFRLSQSVAGTLKAFFAMTALLWLRLSMSSFVAVTLQISQSALYTGQN